jgi:hypothetical protein
MRKWETPKLMKLVRGSKDEKVLLTCKHWLYSGASGPSFGEAKCFQDDFPFCSNCSDYPIS